MAEKKEVTLRAVLREGRGKNDARRARRDGQVPVTIYGGEGGTVAALASCPSLLAAEQPVMPARPSGGSMNSA